MAVTLPVRKLAPFGVEIECDLSQPFAPSEAFHFQQLFREYGLILARGQMLSMERQREICGLLGPILLREGENGYMSNEGGGPSASALNWHSDAAYTDHPFDALALHAVDVVDGESSTRFVSAELGFENLPTSLREALAGRDQEMISPHYTMLAERTCDRRDPESLKRAVRPAIFTNQHNGQKCIWVSELQTACLLGMEWEESRDLLGTVFDHLYAPDTIFEHHWRTGDVIIWDNIALQHARGNLESVGKRVLQRVIVGAEGVAPHISGD